MQLWPIMLSARMPGLTESFCSLPLSCACGWAPKSHEEAAAAQSHQCCAGKLSIAAGHQRLLWRGVHLASAWIPCSLRQVCVAWFVLFSPKVWHVGAFDQGVFLVGKWFSPDAGGSLGDIPIFHSENILQLRAASPPTLFSHFAHCAPAQQQWGCQSWRSCRSGQLCSASVCSGVGGGRSRGDGQHPCPGCGCCKPATLVFPVCSEQLDTGPLTHLLQLNTRQSFSEERWQPDSSVVASVTAGLA